MRLGIGLTTLYEKQHEFAQFVQAFKKGRAAGCAIAASVIFDTINKSKQESLRPATASPLSRSASAPRRTSAAPKPPETVGRAALLQVPGSD
jgi:hypothetical protein